MRGADQATGPRAVGAPAEAGTRAAHVIKFDEPGYPRLLREINDPPPRLWVKGQLPKDDCIAIVGSRACTYRGRQTAYRLAADVCRAGLVVVSGLARGIDAAAHRGALDAGGKTIAVLPSGIDNVYPPSNRRLAARIVSAGALVTEFEPGTEVRKWSFIQRNRLIAGLALAIVVVEAAVSSGAKITAKYAAEYNRDLLAVPGPLGAPKSEGAIQLLVEGAAVCTGVESVIDQLRYEKATVARRRLKSARSAGSDVIEGLDAAAKAVLAAMPATGSCSVDRLGSATGLDVGSLLAALTDLEVRGLLRSTGGQRYERK